MQMVMFHFFLLSACLLLMLQYQVNRSIAREQDLATLVSHLACEASIEVTVSHWIRIAFSLSLFSF